MPIYPPTSETITASTPVTASLVPPIPVPTHGPGGSMSILAKTHISASPAAVLAAIRNISTWPHWNTFCPRCTISGTSSSSAPPPSAIPGLETGKEGWLEVGNVVTIEVFMKGNGLVEGAKKDRDQGIEITRLDVIDDKEGDGGEEGRKGLRIAWKSTGMSHWQLRSERVMELVEDGEGTQYTCWETFGGLLGSVVKAAFGGQLVDRFGDYARDLKGFVEGQGKKNGSA